MKINIEFLREALLKNQFHLAWVSLGERTVAFVRKSSEEDLFERVSVSESGKAHDILSARIGLYVVQHRPFWKGLGNSVAVTEFDNRPDRRGETHVKTGIERLDWLSKLSINAPRLCDQYTRHFAGTLLKETRKARRLCKLYVEKFGGSDTIEGAILQELHRSGVGPSSLLVQEFVERVAWLEWGQVYRLALLLIINNEQEIEPNRAPFFETADPSEHLLFMQVLCLLVDRLITFFAIERGNLISPPWLFPEDRRELQQYRFRNEVGDE